MKDQCDRRVRLECDEWKAALVCGMFDAGKDILAVYYEKLRRRDCTPPLSLFSFFPFLSLPLFF